MKLTTKDRVQQAALSLFARKGYEATGIRDIAQDAGITVASLYGHMSNKEELLISIMENGLVRLRDSSIEAMRDEVDPVEQLAILVRLHVWTHAKRRQSAIVVDTEIRSLTGDRLEYILTLRDEYERIWRDVIRRGALEGSLDVLEPKLATFAILEMCTGISHWYRPDGELDLPYVTDVFVDAALGLTRARRNGKPMRVSDVSYLDPEPIFARVESRLVADSSLGGGVS